jgi:hypothetical protein
MKNLAKLNEQNIVVNIILANDDFDSEGFVEYTTENPAIIDGDYYLGFFYSPQPYPSWTRSYGSWVSPKPYPTDGDSYEWDETDQDWKKTHLAVSE